MHKTPNALNIICLLKLQSDEKQATHHSVGLISVLTGRFAFATENICRCRFAFAQSKASCGRASSFPKGVE
jgi:hypothetical protein